MSLLGWPLLVLLAVLTLALPVTTLLLWPRVRGPRPLRTGARLSLVGASQVTAVLFVAAALNDYGYFYASWSELFGQSSPVGQPSPAAPGHPLAAAGRASAAGTGTPSATGPAAASVRAAAAGPGWSTRAQWASRGRVESVTITGVRSQLSSHAFVYLPPQYFQAAYRRRAFPAAQVFTGFPGTDLNLLEGPGLPRPTARPRCRRIGRDPRCW